MGSTRSFSAMLNQYLPNALLHEEMIKRDWVMNNSEFDNSWKGGDLIVPFKGIQASSVSFGSLTASNDVGEDGFVRGSITSQPEVWGTMVFNFRDLIEHDKVSEQNFLKILPDAVDQFTDYMKMVVSLSFLNGPSFAKATVDGDASGNLTVDRPERCVLKQKVSVVDDNTTGVTGYIQTIAMDSGALTIHTTRAGGVVSDLSAYTVAQNAKLYFDGSQAQPLTSLRKSLLTSANGGSSTLYGQTKTAYPYLQAINVSGAAVTSSSILQDIFDAYTTIKNRGKGMPNKVLMSYRNLGYVMTILEQQKGSYHIDQKGTKVNAYGWTEIEVFGVKGTVSLIGVQEMDDDVMFFLDPRAWKIYTNGSFRKQRSPDGNEYFVVRNTSGYQYLVDICFFGDLVLTRPSYCGVMYSIP